MNVIISGLKDLKEEIKKMPEKERETEKPDKIVEMFEMILKFNKQNQQGQDLRILTPKQMLGRLPITLAQLKTGNNSEKLKHEIRQLLYFLYRSNNLTTQVYNNLINYIWITYLIAAIIDTIYIIIMETIFMNTENRKTNESHWFKLDLADELNLKNPKKTWL